MKNWLQTLNIFASVLIFVAKLSADVTITLDVPEQKIAPGMIAHYSGRIENLGPNPVFLTAASFSLYGGWFGLEVNEALFYTNVPASLQPAQSWTGQLFEIQAVTSATNGLFFASLSIKGGGNDTADDSIGEPLEFRLSVVAPPPTLLLQPPILIGDAVTLLWEGGPGIKLQSCIDLGFPFWSDVPDSDGESGADLPMTSEQMFYRLSRP